MDSFSNGNVRSDSLASSETASLSPAAANHSSSKSSRKKRARLEDVTGQFFPDEDDIVCGICHEYDPPHPDGLAKKTQSYTTDWVGCDCSRWFHKHCTNKQRFTTLFSCRSVKMKCLGRGILPKSKRAKVTRKSAEPEVDDDVNMTIVHR